MIRHASRLRDKATYANVVATLALFVAVSTGGAFAASKLGKNSVNSKSIRKGAVNSRALTNGGVAIKDLAAKTKATLGTSESAVVNSGGTLESGTARSAALVSTNEYRVTFRRQVAGRCTFAATAGIESLVNAPAVVLTGQGGRTVDISTYDGAGNPMPSAFHLTVTC